MKRISQIFIVIFMAFSILSVYAIYHVLNGKDVQSHVKIIVPQKISNTNTRLIKEESNNIYLSGPTSDRKYWCIYHVENNTLGKEYRISIARYSINSHTIYGSCISKNKVFIAIGHNFVIYDLHDERIIRILNLGEFQLAYPSTNQIVYSNSTVVLNLFIENENNKTQNNIKAKLGVYNITNGEINYIVIEKGALLVAVSSNGKYITYLQTMPWKRENNTEIAETLITKINVVKNKTKTYNISKYLKLREAMPVGDLKVKNDGEITAIVETSISQTYVKINKDNKIMRTSLNLKTTHVYLYNNSIFSVVNNAVMEYDESGKIVWIYRFSPETCFYCDILVNERNVYLFLLTHIEEKGKIIIVSHNNQSSMKGLPEGCF